MPCGTHIALLALRCMSACAELSIYIHIRCCVPEKKDHHRSISNSALSLPLSSCSLSSADFLSIAHPLYWSIFLVVSHLHPPFNLAFIHFLFIFLFHPLSFPSHVRTISKYYVFLAPIAATPLQNWGALCSKNTSCWYVIFHQGFLYPPSGHICRSDY